MSSPQIVYGLTHAGLATNPFCYTPETQYGVKKTASPVYTALAIPSDVVTTRDGVTIDVRQAGSHNIYGSQNAGLNYGLTIPIHPMNIAFLKYGTEPPNYTTPAGTSAESVQFLMKYKRATGSTTYTDHFVFYLGCKPNTTNISISAQGLVEASMEWRPRQITTPSAVANGGLTTPTIPTFSSISGPVFQDSDGGNLPLYVNGVQYAVNNFEINWNNNLIAEAYNGSGLVDAEIIGGIEITGSFTTPEGQDLLLEGMMDNLAQAGTSGKYIVKPGAMVINWTGMQLIGDSGANFEGTPTQSLKHTYAFKCATAGLTTT